MTAEIKPTTQLFKVKISDMVNGQEFTFSCEYTAENAQSARTKAYREFGIGLDGKMSDTLVVVDVEAIRNQSSDVACELFGV